MSAELEIRALLQEGRLPEGKECLFCGAVTTDVHHVLVVCERPEVTGPESGLRLLGTLIWLMFGHLHVAFGRSGEERERGRHVSFRLPLRACSECAGGRRRAAWAEAMRRVPVYARLLEKYPHAEITPDRE